MRQRPKQSKPAVEVDELLQTLFKRAKAQFGSAVKSVWFYDGDFCPACSQREIDRVIIKGKEAVSLNAFIDRETGTLIGYFLCSECACQIFEDAKKHPHTQTAVHAAIENNLKMAHQQHLKKSKFN